jgi:3-oxoacyl-[acyl-carrier protein] reductase
MPLSKDTDAQLNERIALVTGGAQGIGAGICEALAAAGAAVAIVELQIDKAQDLALRLSATGRRVISIAADITREEACRSAVAQTVETFGGLDILVNNAAPSRSRDMLGRIAGADWAAHEQVVLQAAVNMVDAALAGLAGNGRGTVVNIASTLGSAVAIDQCSWPYHVSKAGLNQLTRWLACRLGPSGVRVNAVAPGLVDRDVGPKLTDHAASRAVVETVVPLRRAGRSSDIAQAVIFLCSERSSYITGQVLTVDGGLGLAEVFGASLSAYQAARSEDADR